MDNFWTEDNYYHTTPEVSFTERCIVRYTTVQGQEKLWTCSDTLNAAFLPPSSSLAVLPFFSIHTADSDGDGRIDVVTFVLGLPVNDFANGAADVPISPNTADAIARVEFLPEFTYFIRHGVARVRMTAASLIAFDRPAGSSAVGGPLSALTSGDLVFHSTEPIHASRAMRLARSYEDSPFDAVSDLSDFMNLPNFAQRYASRNQSVRFDTYAESVGGLGLLQTENYNRVLGEDLDALGDFTWRITMRIRSANVMYVPSGQEKFKWAWVQYFCIGYAFQRVFWWIRGFAVKLGLIGSIAIFHRGWRPN